MFGGGGVHASLPLHRPGGVWFQARWALKTASRVIPQVPPLSPTLYLKFRGKQKKILAISLSGRSRGGGGGGEEGCERVLVSHAWLTDGSGRIETSHVSSAGKCTARSYNGTHVMVCPDPPGAKHELECHKNLGRPSSAIALNGELFQNDFPCELLGDCYVIPKNTCPNGHSIIHKTNGFLDPARCTDVPDTVSSIVPTLPPEPQTTRSLTMEVVAEDTRRDLTIALITAGISVMVILAVVIVLYKRRKNKSKSKTGDPEALNGHQGPQVTGNSYTESQESASTPLCNDTGHAPRDETEKQHGGSADVNEEVALTGSEQAKTCIA